MATGYYRNYRRSSIPISFAGKSSVDTPNCVFTCSTGRTGLIREVMEFGVNANTQERPSLPSDNSRGRDFRAHIQRRGLRTSSKLVGSTNKVVGVREECVLSSRFSAMSP